MSDLNRPVLDRILQAIENLYPFTPPWAATEREEFLTKLSGNFANLLLEFGPEEVRAALSNGLYLEECPECPISDEQCSKALDLVHNYYSIEHGIDMQVLKNCAETVLCQS